MGSLLCPICMQYSFAERGDYDICPICGWENDSFQYDNPDYNGGANTLSVNEYRNEYLTKSDYETDE